MSYSKKLLVGLAVVITTLVLTATDASACTGGVACWRCARHMGGYNYRTQGMIGAAPQQFVMQVPGQGGAQNMGLDSLVTILGVLDRIRSSGIIGQGGGGGGGGGGGYSAADAAKIQAQFDELSKRVTQNTSDIKGLVESQQALANKIDTSLKGLDERVTTLDGKVTLLGTTVEKVSNNGDLVKFTLAAKQSRLESLTKLINALGDPKDANWKSLKQLYSDEAKSLSTEIEQLKALIK